MSGNVSLYNETDGRAIMPTPVVGCVGLVPDVRFVPGAWVEGDIVLVAAAPEISIGLAGSEYQALYGEIGGVAAALDTEAEARLVEFLRRSAPVLSLANDASAGGLAVALAEAALWSGIGADVGLPEEPIAWFGEGGGQAIVACAREDVARLGGVPLLEIGVVGGERILDVPLDELRKAWT